MYGHLFHVSPSVNFSILVPITSIYNYTVLLRHWGEEVQEEALQELPGLSGPYLQAGGAVGGEPWHGYHADPRNPRFWGLLPGL